MSEGRYFKRITICRWVTPHFPRYPIAGAYAEFSLITGIGQGWKDVQVLDLETCSRPALRGNRPGTGASAYVLPCWLSENLSMSLINNAFEDMGDVSELYMAITAEDSSIVYYKLSKGLVKPQL